MLNNQEIKQYAKELAEIGKVTNNVNKRISDNDADVVFVVHHCFDDPPNVLDNIADFKNNKIQNINEVVENKFNILLSKYKNADLIYENLKGNIEKNKDLTKKLSSPLYKIKSLKESLGLGAKLNNIITQNDNANLLVTKYFFDKVNDSNNIDLGRELKQNLFDNDNIQFTNNIVDNTQFDLEYFRKNCGIIFSNNIVDVVNESSLVTQLMINFVRSFNTMSYNMSGELIDNRDTYKYKANASNLLQVLHYLIDSGDINIWKYIDDKKFNVEDYLFDNDINVIDESSTESLSITEDSLWPGFTSPGDINYLKEKYSNLHGFYYNDTISSIYNTTSSITNYIFFAKNSNKIDRNLNNANYNYNILNHIITDYYPDYTEINPVLKVVSPNLHSVHQNQVYIDFFSADVLSNSPPICNIIRKRKKLIKLDYNVDNENYSSYGNIKINNDVISPIRSINNVYLKSHVDFFVKEIKKKQIEKLNIDTAVVKQIQKNIKNSRNKYLMLSYSASDSIANNISILKESDIGFKLLWNKNEEGKFESKIFDNKSVKIGNTTFSGFNSTSEDDESDIQSLQTLMSNYYLEGPFFSSSKFLIEVLKDFESLFDSDYINNDDTDSIFTEFCYFNSFLDNGYNIEESVKEVVIKRFVMESIKKRNNVSSKVKKSTLSEYTYDAKIPKELPDNPSEGEINSIVKKFLNSSEALKNISSNIWSSENIENISNRYKLSCNAIKAYKADVFEGGDQTNGFSDFDLRLSIYNTDIDKINSENNSLNTLYILYHNMFYITQRFPFMYNMSYYTSLYNKIADNCYIDSDQQERTVGFSFKNSNILNRNDIRTAINLKNNNKRNNNEEYTVSRFFVSDKFVDLINKKETIFSKIADRINQVIDITISDIDDKKFESEEDMSAFIQENNFIYGFVNNLIRIYAIIHELVSQKKSDLLLQKIYSYNSANNKMTPVPDVFQHSGDVSYLVNMIKFSTMSYNTIYTQCNNESFNFRVEKSDFSEIFDIIETFEDNPHSLTNQTNDFEINANTTNFGLKKVMSDLITSDVSQAFNFDLLRIVLEEKLNIQQNISQISDLVSEAADALDIEPEVISTSIKKDYYMSRLYSNIVTKKEKSQFLYKSFIKNNDKEDLLSFLKNNNVFQKRANSRLIQKNNLLKERGIYTYAFKVNNVDEIIEGNELFKVTIIPRSKVYPDRFYFPIFKYFSKRIKNVTTENYDFGELFYYDKEIVDFFRKIDSLYDEELINTTLYQYIREKVSTNSNFELDEIETVTRNIVDSIIDTHRESIQAKETLKCRYGIDNDNVSTGPDFFESLTNFLPDKSFYEVFGVSRDNFENNSRLIGFNFEKEILKAINYTFSEEMPEFLDDEIYYFNINENEIYYLNDQESNIASPFAINTLLNVQNQINIESLNNFSRQNNIKKITSDLFRLNDINSNDIVKLNNSYEIKSLDFTIKIEVIWEIILTLNCQKKIASFLQILNI